MSVKKMVAPQNININILCCAHRVKISICAAGRSERVLRLRKNVASCGDDLGRTTPGIWVGAPRRRGAGSRRGVWWVDMNKRRLRIARRATSRAA